MAQRSRDQPLGQAPTRLGANVPAHKTDGATVLFGCVAKGLKDPRNPAPGDIDTDKVVRLRQQIRDEPVGFLGLLVRRLAVVDREVI